MTWSQYHSQSEQYASQAEVAGHERDFDRAKRLYRLAAEQEELALTCLDQSKLRTLGITVVSTVSLWYKAGEYKRAREVASHWLNAISLSPFAVGQLNELLAEIEKSEVKTHHA